MKRSGLLYIVLISALVAGIWSCTHPSDDYRADHGIPACEITAPLDSLYGSLINSNEPGAIVTVMRGDEIVYDHAFGLTRLDSADRVTDSTIFNAATATKLVTSVAIMKLAEQGLLSLDDSLSKFFPELPRRFFDKITVAHVLNHTSGLPDLRPTNTAEWNSYVASHSSVFSEGLDYRRYGTEREFLRSFYDLDSVPHAPGEEYDPSDISYVLIAPLIETVTGQRIGQWMRENIFDIADMEDTFYYIPGVRSPRMAHGYRKADGTEPLGFRSEDGKWDEYDYNEAEFFLTKADKGLFTSARDFMKFKRALTHGDLINAESIELLLKPGIGSIADHVSQAENLHIYLEPDGHRKLFHRGSNGGFAVIEGWWPEKDVHYIVMMARNDLDRNALMQATDSIIHASGWLR